MPPVSGVKLCRRTRIKKKVAYSEHFLNHSSLEANATKRRMTSKLRLKSHCVFWYQFIECNTKMCCYRNYTLTVCLRITLTVCTLTVTVCTLTVCLNNFDINSLFEIMDPSNEHYKV